MRIVIDMQGMQTESRFRGIGRYSRSLAQAIVRNRGEHEVLLAVSGLLPDTIESVRAAFDGILPQDNIRAWYAPGPTREVGSANGIRREIAENVREAFIESLQPNVVLVTSLFEGIADDAITSVGHFDKQTPVAVLLYDLIPLISPDVHFRASPLHQTWYARKIESIKNSALLLAISESSRNEALTGLGWDSQHVVNISSGYDEGFKPASMSEPEAQMLLGKVGVTKPFLMYTGGADERKNLASLIRAFALLPRALREQHQLLIVGKMPKESIARLQAVAKSEGVTKSELVFTGYVSDEDLVKLYTLCHLFVFPSIHEGFGLPPLEAMACGAPVITSNATSLPEVVGRSDATFDPNLPKSIARKMEEVLRNDDFRRELALYGLERATTFSWDKCAAAALAAMEAVAKTPSILDETGLRTGSARQISTTVFDLNRAKKKILISKLDHMGDWILAIPAILKLRASYPHAEIDALVGSWNVDAAKALGIFKDVHVLDYFSKKSSMSSHVSEQALKNLVSSMPRYDLAIDMRRQPDTRFILLRVPAKRHVGYATDDETINEKLHICLPSVMDQPFVKTALNTTHMTHQILQLVDSLPSEISDYVHLPRFGDVGRMDGERIAIFPRAGNDVKEWGDRNFLALIELLLQDKQVNAVTIYTVTPGDGLAYQGIDDPKFNIQQGLSHPDLLNSLTDHSVCIANNSYGAHLASYLGLSVVGVYGGHETAQEWGPAFGRATVVYMPVECSPCHIATREECKAGMKCLEGIAPDEVHAAVQRMFGGAATPYAVQKTVDDVVAQLVDAIAPLAASITDQECLELAACIDRSIKHRRQTRWYVDISELVRTDVKTGIQRVVRSILTSWLNTPPVGVEIVPIYADETGVGFRHAGRFMPAFTGRGLKTEDVDELAEFQAGDVFLGLDLNPSLPEQRDFMQSIRNHGVSTYIVVYDMLPAQMPHNFPKNWETLFRRWLEVVSEGHGALCISHAVANELAQWIGSHGIPREPAQRPFHIGWFHLGADIENSHPSDGLPENWQAVETLFQRAPTFLMVGTLDPRKGHTEVLDAFDKLWAEGFDANLVIIGKQGWWIDGLSTRLIEHPENMRRMIWLEGASDQCLKQVYAKADCLIAASLGEGFGLPLIEAAQHGLPILARDLPVFKEVAGEYASYFGMDSGQDLTDAIRVWLESHAAGDVPESVGMPFQTWRESAEQLAKLILYRGRPELMQEIK